LETLVLAEEENLSTGRNILGESKQQFCPYDLPIGKMKAERFSLYVVRLHVTKIKKKNSNTTPAVIGHQFPAISQHNHFGRHLVK